MKTDNVIKGVTHKDIVRFWSKVVLGAENECWEWLGGRKKSGHGSFPIKGWSCLAHRVSFYLKKNTLPALVMHDCENPGCVNPSHLLVGDKSLNAKYAKCRAKMSAAKLGNKHFLGKKHSIETKTRMRAAHLGKKRSAETKAKIGNAHRGKTLTAETKNKIRAGQFARRL